MASSLLVSSSIPKLPNKDHKRRQPQRFFVSISTLYILLFCHILPLALYAYKKQNDSDDHMRDIRLSRWSVGLDRGRYLVPRSKDSWPCPVLKSTSFSCRCLASRSLLFSQIRNFDEDDATFSLRLNPSRCIPNSSLMTS